MKKVLLAALGATLSLSMSAASTHVAELSNDGGQVRYAVNLNTDGTLTITVLQAQKADDLALWSGSNIIDFHKANPATSLLTTRQVTVAAAGENTSFTEGEDISFNLYLVKKEGGVMNQVQNIQVPAATEKAWGVYLGTPTFADGSLSFPYEWVNLTNSDEAINSCELFLDVAGVDVSAFKITSTEKSGTYTISGLEAGKTYDVYPKGNVNGITIAFNDQVFHASTGAAISEPAMALNFHDPVFSDVTEHTAVLKGQLNVTNVNVDQLRIIAVGAPGAALDGVEYERMPNNDVIWGQTTINPVNGDNEFTINISNIPAAATAVYIKAFLVDNDAQLIEAGWNKPEFKVEQSVSEPPTTVPGRAHANENIMAFYAGAVDNVVYKQGDWNQDTETNETSIAGNPVLHLKNFTYLGWAEFNVDLSQYEGLHVDYFTHNGENFKVSAISLDPTKDTLWEASEVVQDEWNSYNIPLSYFSEKGHDLSSIQQIKFDSGVANGAANRPEAWVANVYFYKKANTEQPVDPDPVVDESNLLNKAEIVKSTYFAQDTWNQLNPQPELTATNTSFSVHTPAETGNNKWHGQVVFSTDIISKANATYDFSCKINVPADGVVTVKLQKKDTDGTVFIIEDAVNVTAGGFNYSFAEKPGFDGGNIEIVFDFAGYKDVDVSVENIVLKENVAEQPVDPEKPATANYLLDYANDEEFTVKGKELTEEGDIKWNFAPVADASRGTTGDYYKIETFTLVPGKDENGNDIEVKDYNDSKNACVPNINFKIGNTAAGAIQGEFEITDDVPVGHVVRIRINGAYYDTHYDWQTRKGWFTTNDVTFANERTISYVIFTDYNNSDYDGVGTVVTKTFTYTLYYSEKEMPSQDLSTYIPESANAKHKEVKAEDTAIMGGYDYETNGADWDFIHRPVDYQSANTSWAPGHQIAISNEATGVEDDDVPVTITMLLDNGTQQPADYKPLVILYTKDENGNLVFAEQFDLNPISTSANLFNATSANKYKHGTELYYQIKHQYTSIVAANGYSSTAPELYTVKTVDATVDDKLTGIEDVEAEVAADAAPVFYNLQGVQVRGQLAPGIYIQVKGNKTSKILVR